MQISDERTRNIIILAVAIGLIVICVGAAAMVGFLFVTGRDVNVILISFVALTLGQMFAMVQRELGFSQGVNVMPIPSAPTSSMTTTQKSEVVQLPQALPVSWPAATMSNAITANGYPLP
jgi:hypothetical protein